MDDLASEAAAIGLHLSADAVFSFAAYRDLLLNAATEFNLTAVRDASGIERRHFLESLALGSELAARGLLPLSEGGRLLDIGSGAGFPGLPIAIVWTSGRIALLEANHKRCAFLREVVSRLGLGHVSVLEGRSEQWARDTDHRESYDLVLARAVAPLRVLLEYAVPFLKPGGRLVAPKGSAGRREMEESVTALAELGATVESATPFAPPSGPEQTLIIVRKLKTTSPRYPRREGIARKRPL